jgi:bifunctional non-homologous end joining protein LigD
MTNRGDLNKRLSEKRSKSRPQNQTTSTITNNIMTETDPNDEVRTEEQEVKKGEPKKKQQQQETILQQTDNVEFPTIVSPMLATLVDNPFDNRDWVFEVKWDGVRAILFLNKTKQIFELKSRNLKSITHRYPELLLTLEAAIKCKECRFSRRYRCSF